MTREVAHKAFVDVNEVGTEATAEPQPHPVFRADHPFVFAIVDRRSQAILFLGRVVDPRR